MVGFARAGSILFWKPYENLPADTGTDTMQTAAPAPALPFVAVFTLVAALVALSVFSGPVSNYTDATAGQLFDPSLYIDAVLKRGDQ
jgi:multicomponent K+:H+ antiporter subunit D